jgi:hypothetical protein
MNKRERHKLYKQLLKIVCADPEVRQGICYYLANLTTLGIMLCYRMEELLPELYEKAPKKWKKNFFSYWFPTTYEGWKKRIAIIEQCIEKTK